MNAVKYPTVFRIAFFTACLCPMTMAAEQPLALVDKSGVNITANPVSCDGTNLTIIRESDKKTFTIPLARLDDSSQAKVKTWMTKGGGLREDLEIVVETNKNRRTTGREDFDDKRVNLEPVVTIRNPDTRISSRKAKATVLFLGRPVSDNTAFLVFKKSVFDLPELAPLGSTVFEIGKISSAYDTRGYAKFGARYAGYVVLIHDESGEKLYDAESIPTALAPKFGLKFLALDQGQTYNRDLH